MSLDDFKNLYRHEFKRETTDKRGGVPGVDYSHIGLPPTVSHTRTAMPARPERKNFAPGHEGDYKYQAAYRAWVEEVFPGRHVEPDPGPEPSPAGYSAADYERALRAYHQRADAYEAAMVGPEMKRMAADAQRQERDRAEQARHDALVQMLQRKVALGTATVSDLLTLYRTTGYTPTGRPLPPVNVPDEW